MAAVIRKIAGNERIFMKFYMAQYFDLKSSNLTLVLVAILKMAKKMAAFVFRHFGNSKYHLNG